jgi:hypothetical protein
LNQSSKTRSILTTKTHCDHLQLPRKILGALRPFNIFRLFQNQPWPQHTLPDDLVGCVFAWINHPTHDQFSPQKRTATISSFPAKSSVRYGLSTSFGFPKINRRRNTPYRICPQSGG